MSGPRSTSRHIFHDMGKVFLRKLSAHKRAKVRDVERALMTVVSMLVSLCTQLVLTSDSLFEFPNYVSQ